jgi:hypothetical protein
VRDRLDELRRTGKVEILAPLSEGP